MSAITMERPAVAPAARCHAVAALGQSGQGLSVGLDSNDLVSHGSDVRRDGKSPRAARPARSQLPNSACSSW